jgi:6,7-dimethyl-8-ribityllumazine synthase
MSLKFLIIESPYYTQICEALVDGATAYLKEQGASFERIAVPGALEIPLAIKIAHESPKVSHDGYIALGCVIRGETSHYDIVCNESAAGLSRLALEHNLAIGNGILTCDTMEQALVRALPDQKNKGKDAALAALSLARYKKELDVQ